MQSVPHINPFAQAPVVPGVTLNAQGGMPPSIQVLRFYTTYKQKYDTVEYHNPRTGEVENRAKIVPGQMDEVHMCEYRPLASDKVILSEDVRRLAAVDDMNEAQKNPAILMAAFRWQQIAPLYERWKQGHEVTPDGTPLAGWAGVGPEQAEALRLRGIVTVQQLAALGDTQFQSLGIPNMRHLRDNAVRFLSSLDGVKVAADLAEKDAQIASLIEQVNALAEMVRQQQLQPQAPANTQPVTEDDPAFDPGDDFVDPTLEAAPTSLTKPKRR